MLVVTKVDLITAEVREQFQIYERSGWPILFTSSVTHEGIEAVRARVRRDFESGVRAGVVTTPTLFIRGRMLLAREIDLEELQALA